MVPVFAVETAEGWILETADEARDLLFGPVPSEKEIITAAEESDFEIITTQVLTATNLAGTPPILRVEARQPGDLFRIGDHWYRLIQHVGSKSLLHTVGGKDEMVKGDTAISEISVLSKR